MKHSEYFINVADSTDRCPCAKCGALPIIARQSSGGWVAACPNCDLKLGFDSVNPRWFRQTKDDAIYIWSGRQLAQRVFCGALAEELIGQEFQAEIANCGGELNIVTLL